MAVAALRPLGATRERRELARQIDGEMEALAWREQGRDLITTIRPAALRLYAHAVVDGNPEAAQLAAGVVYHLDVFAKRFSPEAA
jgi:hypothetical protein